ncbi:MAG: tRNA 2-selenouridine(34) synthase MnmH [Cyanobacteriota bacterium]|jgi:tRNA 2-selenouridine synthase
MADRLPIQSFLRAPGPVVDVRAPAEYGQGHIPGALSLPLFSDEERAAVGTAYRQQSRQAAVQLGLELVGPKLARLGASLSAWSDAAGGAPLRLHCWRGGMRSESVAWLAGTLGLPTLLLEGGYKAYRRHVLELLEEPWPIRLLGGRTGSGKTDLLLALRERGAAVLDLEGLAHHRGSSFGGLGLPPQPSNEHYENRIATALEGCRAAGEIWVEAESVQVGRCRVPAGLWRRMQQAPLLEIRRPLEERLRQLVAVYGVQDPQALAEATGRIARRLGPQRTAAALEAIGRRDWSAACSQMLDYYDRCYDHELERHGETDRLRLLGSVDLGRLDAGAAADRLLAEGRIRAGATEGPSQAP